ncbi:MAG TPA: hypothetical protein VK923_11160 [Euzebyales bacterium]|nr:hypothetical protein [Euzebyales bacterium]
MNDGQQQLLGGRGEAVDHEAGLLAQAPDPLAQQQGAVNDYDTRGISAVIVVPSRGALVAVNRPSSAAMASGVHAPRRDLTRWV